MIYATFNGITEIVIEMVQILIGFPEIDVNIQNRRDETALFYATRDDNIKMVQILIDFPGIDVNIPNMYGDTALDFAT